MKRKTIVGALSGLFGSALLSMVLSASGIVGAQSAEVRSARSMVRANEVSAATLLAGLGMPEPNAVPGTAAHFDSAPVERLLNPDGTLNLNISFSGTLDLRGWNVTLDSLRGPILTRQGGEARQVPARSSLVGGSAPLGVPPNIPQLDGWSALPHNGLNSGVRALAVSGSDLYVGGDFTQTADGAVTNLNNIAKFSGGTWSALPHNGLNGAVLALAFIGSDLYVGGGFHQTADGAVTNLNYISRFSGGAWSALPHNGLLNSVAAFAVSGSDLYVGGAFTQTADGAVTNLNRIAKFSGGAWSALPNNGLDEPVLALAFIGSDLYVGGFITQTADGAVTFNYIAKFSGGVWSALPHNGLNTPAIALAVSGSDLYVGGGFTQTSDGAVTNLNKIAKFSGGAWSALPHNGLNNQVNSAVLALAASGSDLYVGGAFTQTADTLVTNLNNIAKFSGGAWSALPHNGLNSHVWALAVSVSNLHVGGVFTQTADGAVTNLNSIAKLSGDVDTDGDGLLDGWETNGITLDGGAGPMFIDLPAMGADPNKPDIFLQIDWMQNGTHSHALNSAAIKKVVDAFAASPYVGPTGSVGINLHVDEGPTSILNFTTGTTWGAMSKAHALTHVANLGTFNGSGGYVWFAFQTIKDAAGGFTQSGRTPIFHYVIAAHNYGTDTSSGLSRGISASDLIVSLGSFTGGVGSINEQAGTLMHELGHNLDLHHGGGDDVNYKPNYLSIMSYGFQMNGVIKGGVQGTFDYSRSAMGVLDETNLDEPDGLGAPAISFGTWHYCASTDTYEPVINATAAIDWDCNGNSTNTGVVYDINGDYLCISPGLDGVLETVPNGDDVIVGTTIGDGPNRRCDSFAAGDDAQKKTAGEVQPSPFTGYNDWVNVKFKVGGIGLAGITPVLPMTTEDDPMTVAEASKIPLLPSKLFLPLITR